MLHINFTSFPVLATERLILRQFKPEDIDVLYEMRSNTEVMNLIRREPARSKADVAVIIKKINDEFAANNAITWAISMKDNPVLIGTIGFWRIEKENYRAEIGYMLHPDHHQKGIMHEAMQVALDYAFHVLGLHSVEAWINPINVASRKLAEKSGFVQEAYYRENIFFDGRFQDSVVYSLLKP